MVYQSYVYKVTNKITGQFYYGSRTENVTKKRSPEDDLWKHYFTSSKKVKKLIEEYGIDSFDVQIISKHDTYEASFWEEQALIKESKNDPCRLNKAWMEPETGKRLLSSWGESEEERFLRISKMQKNKKGRFNSNGRVGFKHSEETKRKIAAQAGWKHTEAAKEKMKAHVRTDEHRKNMSMSQKGKPWSEARRRAYEEGKQRRIEENGK